MILTGKEILSQVERGRIQIDPFDPKFVNPASVDLTLGDEIGIYEGWVDFVKEGSSTTPEDGRYFRPLERILNVKDEPILQTFKIDPKRGWVLQPGIGYLAHTKERVCTNFYVPVLDGKSSIGRLFIVVHVTAGYGDPGFDGQYTLEVTVTHPVRVFPGMRICQMRFHTTEGEVTPYGGNYTGETATGPVGSRCWKQF